MFISNSLLARHPLFEPKATMSWHQRQAREKVIGTLATYHDQLFLSNLAVLIPCIISDFTTDAVSSCV